MRFMLYNVIDAEGRELWMNPLLVQTIEPVNGGACCSVQMNDGTAIVFDVPIREFVAGIVAAMRPRRRRSRRRRTAMELPNA